MPNPDTDSTHRFNKLRTILIEQLGVEDGHIQLAANIETDLGADSFDKVELIMAFEEEFKLDIPNDDADRLHTVQDVLTYFEENAE
jgi:acyl carrier protein